MKTQGNMFWEMRPPLPFLLFILSGLLIFGADHLMIDHLGKSPLEGELNLLDKENKRAEEIRQQEAEAKKKAEDIKRRKALGEMVAEETPETGGSLLGYVIFSAALLLALGSTFACVVAFEKKRRAELAAARALAPPEPAEAGPEATAQQAPPRPRRRIGGVRLANLAPALPSFSTAGEFLGTRRGVAVLNILLGVLMLAFGVLYLHQGRSGMAALQDDMDRIAAIYPKDDDRDAMDKTLDRDKESEYRTDARRRTRGIAFLSVGGVMVVLSTVFFQITPPARRRDPEPGRERAPAGQG